jgi:hypothetical protein
MTDKPKEKNGPRNTTICTKATERQQLELKRLARRRKQTVSKTLNELIDIGLAHSGRQPGDEQGVVPRGEQRVNPSEK